MFFLRRLGRFFKLVIRPTPALDLLGNVVTILIGLGVIALPSLANLQGWAREHNWELIIGFIAFLFLAAGIKLQGQVDQLSTARKEDVSRSSIELSGAASVAAQDITQVGQGGGFLRADEDASADLRSVYLEYEPVSVRGWRTLPMRSKYDDRGLQAEAEQLAGDLRSLLADERARVAAIRGIEVPVINPTLEEIKKDWEARQEKHLEVQNWFRSEYDNRLKDRIGVVVETALANSYVDELLLRWYERAGSVSVAERLADRLGVLVEHRRGVTRSTPDNPEPPTRTDE